MLYIDLDHFKPVNDRLGHAAGDTLLVTVSQRLLGCVRREDTVARLGGDEFAVLLEDLASESDAEALAGRITELLGTPLTIGGEEVKISASVGVAVHDSGSVPGRRAATGRRHRDVRGETAGQGAVRGVRTVDADEDRRSRRRLARRNGLSPLLGIRRAFVAP